ncbi:MAG: M24 family metallopeptidase [Planctomycetaceae bacterium]
MVGPNYDSRRGRLQKKLREAGIDGLLVTGQANVRYLTGFTGDSSWLLMLSGHPPVLLSDTRYETQLADECPGLAVEIRDAGGTLPRLFAKLARVAKVRRVGFEADHVTVSLLRQLENSLASGGPEAAVLTDTAGLVERLREVKDKFELAEIREAIRIAERGFAVVRSSLRGSQTETEIRYLLESAMRDFGGSGTAFEPIVGVGPTAALPHAHAGERRVSEHSVLLVDWGAAVKSGYRSDLTRVLITGKPTKQIEKVYGVVLGAQRAAISAIRPGVRCADVDRIARGMIADSGFGKFFGHGLGHGFGLEIHESVRMSPLSEQVFEAGMVVTVEPGVYLPGKFGVRIEDDLLVTAGGCEVLSSVPREFEDSLSGVLA